MPQTSSQNDSQAGRHGDRIDETVIGQPVNINTASREELRMVQGLGDARADEIVAWRERNGRFESVGDLQHLPLIGPDALERIRGHLTV
ncbi:helix-hairpin-helix domain-containing protein [Rhodospirillaceae bacterium SYSU D60014]|uniref:ComEA family DNA-binding protein n=1 Tax=Virgifigura deserti TaxID=2268457 RepID=UPI000E667BC2